jgi:hypothetical protein
MLALKTHISACCLDIGQQSIGQQVESQIVEHMPGARIDSSTSRFQLFSISSKKWK